MTSTSACRTTAVVGGEKVVLRLLDKSRPLFRLAQLGMPDDTDPAVLDLAPFSVRHGDLRRPDGQRQDDHAVRLARRDQQPERNIMTIEDPVEYTFPSINQIQINEQAGITFAGGLKSILRQDPDVILVGEVRDVETARIAVQSALTGHFVLSSLHATDAVSALHRLLDMGIETFLVASSVTAVAVPAPRATDLRQLPQSRYDPPPEEMAFLRLDARHGFPTTVSCVAPGATSARTPATWSGSASTS